MLEEKQEEEYQILGKGPLEISIKPLMTVKELKLKTLQDYNIPIELQRWLINDQNLNDNDNLIDCGIKDESNNLNLYLNSTQSKDNQQIQINCKLLKTSDTIELLTDENDNNAEEDILHEEQDTPLFLYDIAEIFNEEDAATALPIPDTTELPPVVHQQQIIEDENFGWKCLICTFINQPLALACTLCYQEKPLSIEEKFNISEELKIILNNENDGDLNQSEINNIIDEIIKPTTDLNIQIPQLYTTPHNNNVATSTKSETTKICHYIEILNLDTNDIVRNTESFDCPICYINIEPNDGCVLRDCLHTFCRDCLSATIEYSEEPEIKCPYANQDYSCNCILQDREIKSLVTLEIYEKYLTKSIRKAEHQIKNSFHCKTPNCQGWCICDDNVHEFQCPVCKYTNCLICRVIHNGLTCYEYQDELNGKVKTKSEIQTDDMIKQMVNTGQVMNCPTCLVIITKISGCDWLQCLMCKTEVCWATRKPRRGPNGCKCGENGVKCHPNCGNCH